MTAPGVDQAVITGALNRILKIIDVSPLAMEIAHIHDDNCALLKFMTFAAWKISSTGPANPTVTAIKPATIAEIEKSLLILVNNRTM